MSATLFDLPNEVILHVLGLLTTTSLLHLSVVSTRLYALTCRELARRLQLASQLPQHTLLLESYHPSAKLTEPPFYCTYLRTEGLGTGRDVDWSESPDSNIPLGRIGAFRELYSIYRPQRRPPDDNARRMRHPAGDVPGSRTHPASALSWIEETASRDVVRQSLVLEGHELFTQLIASLNLARSGPRRGLFFSFVDVGEGVVRVWRDWLECAADACDVSAAASSSDQRSLHGIAQDKTILWVDSAKRVGLRLQVHRSRWRRAREMPVLMAADDQLPVSYDIEYEELIVRTSHLILTLEASMAQQSSQSGKAIVFGSFG